MRGRHFGTARLENGDLHIAVGCAMSWRVGSEQCVGGCGVDERRGF